MKAKQFEDDANVKVHKIRITLTSRNVKNLEKGAHYTTGGVFTAHLQRCWGPLLAELRPSMLRSLCATVRSLR